MLLTVSRAVASSTLLGGVTAEKLRLGAGDAQVDSIVVGAGVVGLAKPGCGVRDVRVLLLERLNLVAQSVRGHYQPDIL